MINNWTVFWQAKMFGRILSTAGLRSRLLQSTASYLTDPACEPRDSNPDGLRQPLRVGYNAANGE